LVWGKRHSYLSENDDKVPEYMVANQKWYLSKTLKQCCERHFAWDLNKCMGITEQGTNKWYVDWGAAACVQDCVGATPCGGVAESWISASGELFGSKKECCKKKMGWDSKCLTK
jgi:hypothetical protein